MPAANDPNLVAKALAKAQSVEARLNALVPQITPQLPVVVYNQTTTVVTQAAAGSYTWTCPAGITSVMVECWGAGAGGGGGGGSQGGEGGGGGAYSAEASYAVTPGTVYAYVVGNAGTGGIVGHGGNSGGSSFFDTSAPSGFGIFAGGGSAGASFTGGAGAAAGTNTVAWAGGDGSGDGGQLTGGCGGGSSASPVANGNNGAGDSAGATGTAGGAGAADSGAGGAGGNNGLNGINGSSPGGGGGGCGAATASSQVTLNYQPTNSGTYYGSDATGGGANNLRNAGSMYQSGTTSSGGSYRGTQKGLMILPTTVSSDLAGVTIDSVSMRMKNLFSWYDTGVTVLLGYTAKTSLPSSWDGTGATHTNSYHVNQFANSVVDVTSGGLGAALKSGAAKSLYLGLGGAYNASEYGEFFGASGSDPGHAPLLTVVGHTGGAQAQAGNGAAGQVRITYQAPASIIAAVQPVAGTDQYGFPYVAGLSGQNLQLYGNVTPATPPAGSSILYTSGGGSPTLINSTGLNGQVPATRGNVQTFTNSGSGSMISMTASWGIPANDANVGTCYRLKVYGNGTMVNGAVYNMQIAIFGGTQTTGGVNGSGSGGFYWSAEATVMIVTLGSSGTALMNITGVLGDISRGAVMPFSQGTNTVTVNTTAATTMAIQAAVSNGSSVIAGYYSTFERLGA